MLDEPQQQQPEAPKRSEAVFITDRFQPTSHGWHRYVTFWYEGEDHGFALEAINAGTEENARRKLYGPAVDKELRSAFLESVRLDMTRPH